MGKQLANYPVFGIFYLNLFLPEGLIRSRLCTE